MLRGRLMSERVRIVVFWVVGVVALLVTPQVHAQTSATLTGQVADSSQAVLPGSREILVVAQHQHRILIDAIREGHSARAEEVGREHARLTLASLDLVLENHPLLAGVA